jgi:hypothetical protein
VMSPEAPKITIVHGAADGALRVSSTAMGDGDGAFWRVI